MGWAWYVERKEWALCSVFWNRKRGGWGVVLWCGKVEAFVVLVAEALARLGR